MKTNLLQRPSPQEEMIRPQVLQMQLLIILFLFLSVFPAKALTYADVVDVNVSVADKTNSEAIPFANVVVYLNGVMVGSGTTDFDGRCKIKNLSPGKYDFKAAYVGYTAQEIKKVEVFADKTNWLNIQLRPGEFVITCCCVCYCFDRPTENWWPKLWTPYREAYAEWKAKKEKREAKKALQPKKENKTEVKAIDYSEVIVLSDPLPEARIAELAAMKQEVTLFPNPCKDVLHLEAGQALQQVEIRDASGKLLNETTMNGPRAAIQLENYSNGMYYLNYIQNGKAQSKKFVVVN